MPFDLRLREANMKLFKSHTNYKITLLLIFIILIATVAVATGRKLILGVKGVQVEKFCDATIKYCATQKCKIPFRQLRSGVISAYAFFEKLGYNGKYFVDLELTPEVSIVWGEGKDKMKIRVLGKYEEGEKKIYLTCWGEKWLAGANDFKLNMTPEYYKTLVAHEMIHFLASRFTKNKLNVTLSEYLAYSGQLELFREEKIKLLLKKYKVAAFEENEIYEWELEMNPAIFGLKSYLHYKRTKGLLAKEIIAGTFNLPYNEWLYLDFPQKVVRK